jgi:hypothetical protein
MTTPKTKSTLRNPKKSRKKEPHPVSPVSVLPPLPKDDSRIISGAMAACCNCETFSQCRRRVFSEKAWSALLLWQEIPSHAINQPICDECYKEMRDILMERSEELDVMIETYHKSPIQEKAS